MSGFASIARNNGQGAGGANTDNAAATTQFGEALVAQLSPAAQATFVNGVSVVNFITRSIGAGSSISSVGNSAVLQSGTASTGSAAIQMRRGLTYRPGQGSIFRGTAVFGPTVANNYQLIGFGNVESGYYFGYSGTNFGVHHFPDGIREVRKLTVDAGVASSTSVTVTLNGESATYSIAGGSSTNQTAWEISQQDWTNVGGGWVAEEYDGIVYFIALKPGTRNGSYSTSGTGLTATFSQFITGSSANATFVSQSAWNIDTMDGNGPSRMVLDPTKGNVYQVGFQYLGFGNARFAIEDPQTGQFQACHMIRNANSRLTPVLKDPHVSGIWAVSNVGSTTSTHMSGTSGAVFCEGEVLRNIGPAFSYNAVNTDVDTVEKPVLSIRSNRIFGSNAGYGEIDFSTFTAATPGASNSHYMIFRIYKNLRLTGPVNFTNVNATQSIASYDTAATGYSANQNSLIATYVINAGSSLSVDLKGDNFFLAVGESLTVTAESSVNNQTGACALTWFEDQ